MPPLTKQVNVRVDEATEEEIDVLAEYLKDQFQGLGQPGDVGVSAVVRWTVRMAVDSLGEALAPHRQAVARRRKSESRQAALKEAEVAVKARTRRRK